MSDSPQIPTNGTWCHIEIPVEDPEAAKKFYGDVFGWTFQDMPEMDYTFYFTAEGHPGGGFVKQGEGIPPQMVNYIATDDIPGTLAKVEASGGSIVVPETPVGDFGWLAWVKDPAGMLFALWKSTLNCERDSISSLHAPPSLFKLTSAMAW